MKKKSQKLKLWQKVELWQNLSCDKTQMVTTQIVIKVKFGQNCEEKTKKKTLCDKTQIVTKLKNSNYHKTKKLKMWQNSRTQIMTRLKTQNVTKLEIWHLKLWIKKNFKRAFIKNILTPGQPMRCSLGSVLRFSQCFV